MDEQARQSVGKAIGRVPSGLFVLTAQNGEERAGVLVSWVQQASFEPPAVSVALARDRAIGSLIKRSRKLALSVLGESDTALMRRFARRGGGADASAFDGVRLHPTPSGLPVLADAVAYMDCRLLKVCDFDADHELLLAEVLDGAILKPGGSFVHQRGNGFHY